MYIQHTVCTGDHGLLVKYIRTYICVYYTTICTYVHSIKADCIHRTLLLWGSVNRHILTENSITDSTGCCDRMVGVYMTQLMINYE